MDLKEIVAYLNAEISRLTSARDLMAGQNAEASPRRGRPKGSTNKSISVEAEKFLSPKRRTMSPEGKARIAAAQKKRWAAQKSTPVKASLTRKSAPVAKKAVTKAVRKPAVKRAIAKRTLAKKTPTPSKAVGPVQATQAGE